MSTEQTEASFGKLRQILWPIHGYELKKFIPMFLMFFFISFNYSTLRVIKDTLVVNAPGGAGGAVIPPLKFCTFAAAIFFMSMYIKLAGRVSKQKLFYITLSPFVLFFILFPTVFYPLSDVIHLNTFGEWGTSVLPEGFKGLIAVLRNWSFSLFYILAELWGSVVLSVLYWGFANETTKVTEAKRFYALFLVGANVALLPIGKIIKFSNSFSGGFDSGIKIICGLAVVGTVGIALCYYFMQHYVLTDPRFANTSPIKKKKKEKLGLMDSLKELTTNKYLGYIAILVLAYGISINLVEVTWKDNLKQLFAGNKAEYANFQGMFMSGTGLLTVIFLYAGTNNILRVLGWKVTALITPIVMLVTSVIFFANLTFADLLQGMYVALGTSSLMMVAIVGGLQNIFSKSAKYAFFDTTKEMAYIPLEDQVKRRGKAAIDGVGGRLGKLGGAGINQVLIMIFGSVAAITPFVAVITIAMIVYWLRSVKKLGSEFEAKTSAANSN